MIGALYSTVDQFTVVGLVTWLLNGSEAGIDLPWVPEGFFS